MNCLNCGAALHPTDQICPMCGRPVGKTTSLSPIPETQPVEQSQEEQQIPPVSATINVAGQPASELGRVSTQPDNSQQTAPRQVPFGWRKIPDTHFNSPRPVYPPQMPPGQPFITGYPYLPMTPPGDSSKNGLAVASMVLGIISLVFNVYGGVTAILGLIFGIIGLKSQKKGMAKAGLIMSIISLALAVLIIVLILVAFFAFTINDPQVYTDGFSYYS